MAAAVKDEHRALDSQQHLEGRVAVELSDRHPRDLGLGGQRRPLRAAVGRAAAPHVPPAVVGGVHDLRFAVGIDVCDRESALASRRNVAGPVPLLGQNWARDPDALQLPRRVGGVEACRRWDDSDDQQERPRQC